MNYSDATVSSLPPAIARAYLERGYSDAQIEAERARRDRLERMSAGPKLLTRALAPEQMIKSPDDVIDAIATVIAAVNNVSVSTLRSKVRLPFVCRLRDQLCWLAYETTGLSFDNLGAILSADGSTALRWCHRVQAEMSADPVFSDKMMHLRGRMINRLAARGWAVPPDAPTPARARTKVSP